MGIQKSIFCFSVACCIATGLYAFHFLRKPIGAEQLRIEHDYTLAYETRSTINAFIKRAAPLLNSDDSISAIKNEFPFLHTCAIRMMAPGIYHITYSAQKPVACLGNTHCITSQGLLVPAEHYCVTRRTALPCIYTALSPDSIADTQPLLSFINHAYEQIRERYTVEYKGDHAFFLHDQINNNNSILTCADILLTQDLLHAINNIFLEKNQQVRSSRTKKNQWIADVRFDNQVILYELKNLTPVAHGGPDSRIPCGLSRHSQQATAEAKQSLGESICAPSEHGSKGDIYG